MCVHLFCGEITADCMKEGGFLMDRELITVSSVKEAMSLKNDGSAFFAGGTEIGHLNSRVQAERLILLPKEPALTGISEADGTVRIGALVTFTKALQDPAVPGYLKEALHFCGSFQKRNMATIGGNIASWRCDSYLVPTLIAAGAALELSDKEGCRTMDIASFARERDSLKDALITAVLVPAGADVLSKRYANTVESHAYLTIAMGRDGEQYRIGLAVKGAGIFTPDILNWGITWKQAQVKDDMFGSESYKRYLTGVTLDDMYEKLSGEGGEK